MIHPGACVRDSSGTCAICDDQPAGIEILHLRADIAELERPRWIAYSCRFDELIGAYTVRAQFGSRTDRVFHYAELRVSEHQVMMMRNGDLAEMLVGMCNALARELVIRIAKAGEL